MRNCGPVQNLAWAERQLMANRMSERIMAVERMGVSSVSTHALNSGHKQANVRVYWRECTESGFLLSTEMWRLK